MTHTASTADYRVTAITDETVTVAGPQGSTDITWADLWHNANRRVVGQPEVMQTYAALYDQAWAMKQARRYRPEGTLLVIIGDEHSGEVPVGFSGTVRYAADTAEAEQIRRAWKRGE